ncbi:MAG: HlyD family type I secretion periplasmic adaptor subunit [Victivallales bacterium]|nr:HlyD family type I secretion periplasmic adaptor subunit [Victivallales bacterium]
MKDNTPAELIEFQPDALEIRNARLPWGIRLSVWIPFLLLVLAIVWAFVAQVDVVVQSTGTLVTDQQTIVMKPLERSVIQSVNVKIGDIVAKDQILITFDPTINRAEAERLDNEMKALQAELSRLQAEFYNRKYEGGQTQFEKWQMTIFSQRQEYYQERMNYFGEAMSQIRASMKSRKDSLAKQSERLEAIKGLEEIFKKLQEKGAAPMKEYIEMSISRMEMESTVDQLENDLLELQHRLGTTQAEKNSFIQQWRNSIAEDMVKVDRTLASTSKEYEKVEQLIEYVHLKAPCECVVHEIADFSPGSAVREAEALITLVPLEGNIELEAEVRPLDIGKVTPGANARVKLTAYPFQKHGTLGGVVRNISENTLQKNMGAQHVTYYRARVTLNGKLHGVKDSFRLIPGMEAQCEIKCGRRRVIEYVLYPLIKALDEAAREP